MMKTLVLAATALVLAAPALAQVPPPAAPPSTATQPATPPAASLDAKVDVFAKADGDKNGALSIAEVKLADASVTQADFDKYDTDKSKSLNKAEFAKWAMAKKGSATSAPGQ